VPRKEGTVLNYLTPIQKLLKLELEGLLEKNKGRNPSIDGRPVEAIEN